VSAYGNLFAGLSLTVSFFTIISIYNQNWATPDSWVGTLQVFTMKLEGALYAIAGLALTMINIWVNNAAGAVGQTIITFGGCFFFVSGWGSPVMTPSLKYLVPMSGNDAGIGMESVAPFYGITCFMVATAYGLWGVSGLPKDKVISPFYGVLCFFCGAWIIGVIGSWIPLLAGGVRDATDFPPSAEGLPTWPMFAWSWTNYFKLIGALFLTAGAVIFAAMDRVPPFFCGRKAGGEPLVDETCGA
jgi:hypothetical protein